MNNINDKNINIKDSDEDSNLNSERLTLPKNTVDVKSPFKNSLLKSIENITSQSSLEKFIVSYKSKFNSTQKYLKESITIDNLFSNLGIEKVVKSNERSIINLIDKNIIPNVDATSNLSNVTKNIIDTLDINNVIKAVSISLNSIGKIFEELEFKTPPKLNGHDSKILDKFYWVVPFEYDYMKIRNLERFKTCSSFEKYIKKYFTKNRTIRLFNKVENQCKSQDKKVLIQQVKKSYFNGDFAICITSLITLLDGLTLQLLEPNSDKQHLSYKVIKIILNHISDRYPNEYSYELYIKVDILNNFYTKLYENEEKFKTTKRKRLSRHINSHGVMYLNRKVDVLRLLNAIYFCQSIIDETKLQEQFTRNKKENKFHIIDSKNK